MNLINRYTIINNFFWIWSINNLATLFAHIWFLKNSNGQDEDLGIVLEVHNAQDEVDRQHEITPKAHIEVKEEEDDEIENENVF